ncbi:MAG: site-specific integrase, partial [Nitrospirota bacterium]
IWNLVRAGIPQSIAMAISGHKTDSVFRRYDIVSELDIAEAGNKLSLYLNNRRATEEAMVKKQLKMTSERENSF